MCLKLCQKQSMKEGNHGDGKNADEYLKASGSCSNIA